MNKQNGMQDGMQNGTQDESRGHLIGLLFVALAAALGIYLLLAGLGTFGRGRNDAPGWVLIAAGGAFVFTALSMGLNAIGWYCFGAVAGKDGGLPDHAPYGLRLAQLLLGLGVVALMATVATWVAFNPGPGGTGRGIVFAIGAGCAWLVFLALAFWKLRKLHP